MSELVVDADLLARLTGLTGPTTFRDPSGRLMGYYTPAKGPVFPLPEDRCPYTPEELQEMRNETGGRPLAEIWKRLGVT